MSQDVKDIKAIFSEALEKQTDDERSAYLGRACGDDAGLREKIENLLKAHRPQSNNSIQKFMVKLSCHGVTNCHPVVTL